MNKKGFTLVELVAVIILISIISTLAIIPITNIVKKSKDEMYDAQINQIILAAENWASDHKIDLYNMKEELRKNLTTEVTYENTPVTVKTLDELINEEHLDDMVKDLKDEKNVIKGCSKVEIFYITSSSEANNDAYRYHFVRMENC